MSQGISFAGLGSGLDTDAIITQLIDIERRPVVLIQRRQIELQRERAAIGSINSSLLSFKDSVAKLEDDDLFSIVNAKSDDRDRISVSATNEAAAGSFSVEVLELAQSRRLSSRSFNSLSDQLELSGDFTVNGKAIELASDGTGWSDSDDYLRFRRRRQYPVPPAHRRHRFILRQRQCPGGHRDPGGVQQCL